MWLWFIIICCFETNKNQKHVSSPFPGSSCLGTQAGAWKIKALWKCWSWRKKWNETFSSLWALVKHQTVLETLSCLTSLGIPSVPDSLAYIWMKCGHWRLLFCCTNVPCCHLQHPGSVLLPCTSGSLGWEHGLRPSQSWKRAMSLCCSCLLKDEKAA